MDRSKPPQGGLFLHAGPAARGQLAEIAHRSAAGSKKSGVEKTSEAHRKVVVSAVINEKHAPHPKSRIRTVKLPSGNPPACKMRCSTIVNKIVNILSLLFGVMILTVYTKPTLALGVATAILAIIILTS